jgi:hypothetical protein
MDMRVPLHQGKQKARVRPFIANACKVECLESRLFLSAASSIVAEPNIVLSSAALSGISGYSPAQIRAAYGFTGISGNGSGQTIAIVDAYNDPNIASDLGVFDAQFGLSNPNLMVVNQNGGSTRSIATNAGWDTEISLDVEWAHAIAPGANILLVEASSDSLSNLMAAVNYARNVSSVSVVSMSWGGSEFSGETAYDSYFTTPSGHQGITFVAAAGDNGASAAEWPASSPNVLSVGGTTLNISSSGAYLGESAWSSGGGGVSQVEPEPTYQQNAQSTGYRSTPDVAYDADPNTGFAIYDSISYDGYVGWQEVGGTSAGAPQWAALVALADQVRVAAGKGTLDGSSQTLPILYSLYSAPGTSGYSSYTTYFNDVTTGSSGYGWGAVSATPGYDAVTGLGTPKAAALVDALAGQTPASSSSSSSSSQRAAHAARAARKARKSRAAQTANVQSDVVAQATPSWVVLPNYFAPMDVATRNTSSLLSSTQALVTNLPYPGGQTTQAPLPLRVQSGQTNRAPLFAITGAAALTEKVAEVVDERIDCPMQIPDDDPAAIPAGKGVSSEVAAVVAPVIPAQASMHDPTKLAEPLVMAPAGPRSWHSRWMAAAASAIGAILLGYFVAWHLRKNRSLNGRVNLKP